MTTRRGLLIVLTLIAFVIVAATMSGCATNPCTVVAENIQPVGMHEGQQVQMRAYLELCPVVH